jgi:hypothetical protein
VFSGPAVRLIGTDGSCLNCQFGVAADPAAGVFGVAANPALLPDGTLLTFVSGGGVFDASIDGLVRDTLIAPAGGVADAVWSSTGDLAVVSRGRVLVGKPGGLHSIGAGGSPSWSPSGSRLAIARRGWVVVLAGSGRGARRLARGSAPAFSPDGRWIAFIGARHRLEVIRSDGGHARTVGHVRGLAVDWQPVPRRRPPPCVAPSGSHVIAHSSQAVVTTNIGPNRGGDLWSDQAVMGCLFADGRERLLQLWTFNSLDNATAPTLAAIAGHYAAVVSRTTDDHYGGCGDSTSVFDLRTGAASGHGGQESAACDRGGGIDQVVVGSDGASAVHVDGIKLSDPIFALCASPSLCIASDQYGSIDSSTDPTAGPWSSSPVGR